MKVDEKEVNSVEGIRVYRNDYSIDKLTSMNMNFYTNNIFEAKSKDHVNP